MFLESHPGGVYLSIKVQPRASKNEIGEPLGDELKIKVTAPPVDSAANQAVVDLLAEVLDCPRGSVKIVRGQTSRHKTIWLEGQTEATVLAALKLKVGASGHCPCWSERKDLTSPRPSPLHPMERRGRIVSSG